MKIWVLILSLVSCTASLADPYKIESPVNNKSVGNSYFGMHFHSLKFRGHSQDPPLLTRWPTGQVGAIRMWNTATRWAELEPQRGQWKFDRLDFYISEARRNSSDVLMTLGSTPQWASAQPDYPCSYGFGCSAEPKNMLDWDKYVTMLARRYKGQIKYYEVWNEPHPGQVIDGHRGSYHGSLETLIELTRRTNLILQKEDPDAILLTPGFVNIGRLPIFEEYLANGGKDYTKGVTFHFYAANDIQFIELYKKIREIMVRQGISERPLFNTESSFEWYPSAEDLPPTAEDLPPDLKRIGPISTAAYTAHTWILGAFLGIDRMYHHAWDNGHSGMIDRQGRPTPNQIMYLAVRRWLLGTRPMGCESAEDNVIVCSGQRNGRQLLLYWRPEPAGSISVQFPKGFVADTAEHALEGDMRAVGWKPESDKIQVGFIPVAVWSKLN